MRSIGIRMVADTYQRIAILLRDLERAGLPWREIFETRSRSRIRSCRASCSDEHAADLHVSPYRRAPDEREPTVSRTHSTLRAAPAARTNAVCGQHRRPRMSPPWKGCCPECPRMHPVAFPLRPPFLAPQPLCDESQNERIQRYPFRLGPCRQLGVYRFGDTRDEFP